MRSFWWPVWSILLLIPAFVHGAFYLNFLIMAHIYAIYVLGWDFVAGVGGEICGGQALAFGGAAYLAGFLGLAGMSPPLVLVCAPAAAAVLGLAVGLLGFRLTGVPFLLVTLVLGEAAYETALAWAGTGPRGLALGGENGLPVPGLAAPEHAWALYYYLTLVLLALAVWGLIRFKASLPGTRMLAVKSDPTAAGAIGLNPGIQRAAAFGLGFLVSGTAGTLYAQFTGAATPGALSLELSFAAVTLSMAGGTGTLVGPAAAAYALNVLFGWLMWPSYWNAALYAAVVVAVARLAPGGLRLSARRWRQWTCFR